MTIRNNCSLVGVILKPFGIKGELLAQLKNINPEKIEPGYPLFVEINGTLIPFFIDEITLRENSAVFKFEFTDSLTEAEKLAGSNLFLHNDIYNEIKKTDFPNLSQIVGYSFFDITSGAMGEIKEFIDNELNPLFLIRDSDKEFLVPANPEIICLIDPVKKKIEAKLPEGLTNL